MDPYTILGIIFGFSSLILGQFLEGADLLSLVNLPALIIVLGGSVAAVVVQTPGRLLKRSLTLLKWVFTPPRYDYQHTIDQIIFWSKMTRQHGLISVENSLHRIKDPFMYRGAELLITGTKPEMLSDVLDAQIDSIESQDINAAKVLESLGGYSPTLGILGAVLGLIHVMQTLTDPSQIGGGIAVAFVATIYGVGFANLLFIPLANRLKLYIYQRTRLYEMYVTGLKALANGENPRMIAMKMNSYLTTSYTEMK